MTKFDRLFELDKIFFKMYGIFLYVRRIGLLIKNKREIESNKILKGLRKSDKCFIIGLGPSLKDIDLSKLDGDIIVTNRFYKVEGAKNISPIIYVIIDNFFYSGEYYDDLVKAIKSFSSTRFVFNGTYKKNIKKSILKRIKCNYIYMWNGFFKGKKDVIDCTKVMPVACNVICASEYVALYMGYKEICLLGCDFNSFASLKKNHVYKDENEERLLTMSNELFQYAFSADIHCQLDIYSKRHGQRIYNLTEGSLIDAYERKSCERYKKHKDY